MAQGQRSSDAGTRATTGRVAVGRFVLDVGSATGFTAFPARAGNRIEARRLAAALNGRERRPPAHRRAADALENVVASTEEVTCCLERIDKLFGALTEGHVLDPAYLDDQLDAALGLLQTLDRSGRFEDAFRLAKALSGVLTLAKRWGRLLESLKFAEHAAEELGDPVAQALVRHQLGTLALGANDSASADRLLKESLHARQGLADAPGAATTQHNLDLVGRRGRGLPRVGRPVPLLLAAGLLSIAIAGPEAHRSGGATVTIVPWSSIVPVLKGVPPESGPPGHAGRRGLRGRAGSDGTADAGGWTTATIELEASGEETQDPSPQESLRNVAPPAIVGTPVVGRTLTATNGTWAGADVVAYQYRWVHCDETGAGCRNVSGIGRPTLRLTNGHAGRRVYVRVKAIGRGGRYDKESSELTDAAQSPVRNVEPPTIAGTAFVGRSLTATRGTWAGTGITGYRFEWHRCDAQGGDCEPIPGADERVHRVTAADAERTLRVAVTAINPLGSDTEPSDASDRVDACDRVDVGVSDALEPELSLPARLRMAHCTTVGARFGRTAVEIPIGNAR